MVASAVGDLQEKITELQMFNAELASLYHSERQVAIKLADENTKINMFASHASNYEMSKTAGLNVGGSLYLRWTQITVLPAGLNVGGGLYLHPQHISNVTYRENCGDSDRTIFAVWMADNFKIVAGCFFDTLEAFEDAVDNDYSFDAATRYKQKARECVTELAGKINKTAT